MVIPGAENALLEKKLQIDVMAAQPNAQLCANTLAIHETAQPVGFVFLILGLQY